MGDWREDKYTGRRVIYIMMQRLGLKIASYLQLGRHFTEITYRKD